MLGLYFVHGADDKTTCIGVWGLAPLVMICDPAAARNMVTGVATRPEGVTRRTAAPSPSGLGKILKGEVRDWAPDGEKDERVTGVKSEKKKKKIMFN